MNQKIIDRLRNQTVQICDEDRNPLGTGFFANDNIVITAEHCLLHKGTGKIIEKVLFFRGEKELCKGRKINVSEGIAFIYAVSRSDQKDRFPLGYCKNLFYGVPIDIYGYPERHPQGYPLHTKISQSIPEQEDRRHPTVTCTVRNVEGALDKYDGLSGAPVVILDHIVGMVVKEDEAGDEVNALYILDFANICDVLSEEEIKPEQVCIQTDEPKKGKCKPSRAFLHGPAWWIRKVPAKQEDNLTISDRYSIVLATLLLGILGKADIVLASPWECGLAECLQEETAQYSREISGWEGRRWIEYEAGSYPDGETAENISGIVLSIHAEDCSDVLLSGLMIWRRQLRKDVLVLWNIWSEQPKQAVLQAARVSGRFPPDEKSDLLTVFPSWQDEPSHTFLVHETASAWLDNQIWEHIDLDSLLLELNTEEIDVLVWEIFQRYENGQVEELGYVFARLWDMCSESARRLISFCEGESDLADLAEAAPPVIKRWFTTVKEEDCDRILSYLREERNQALYWSAVTSNPYCTRYVLREWSASDRRVLIQLILGQNTCAYDDIILYEEAENIRWQIRPR